MSNPWKDSSKQFQDEFIEMYPESLTKLLEGNKLLGREMIGACKSVTIVVTEDCSLRCSYCYQHNKNSHNVMSRETARKTVDMLFDAYYNGNSYLNEYNAQGIIFDFIGGEPLLEIELIDYFMKYFRWKAVQLNHPWAIKHMASISTNGIAYLDEKVQRFIWKNRGRLSITITIDGNKELHDSCRRFPDGSPSYDIVAKSMKRHVKMAHESTTKLTLAPANIKYTFEAIKNLYEEFHLDGVFANCVFEEGWEYSDATILYEQLKLLADWMLDNDIEKDFYCTLFQIDIGEALPPYQDTNWCGGTGSMLSITPNGFIQPCLRYTDFNLNYAQPEIRIGHIDRGICTLESEQKVVKELDSITRKSQSTEECFNCPIASGCAWCSGYNYEVYGTPNKRATFICPMHKARVLANMYYWNKIFRKYNIDKRINMNCPKEWALQIINEEEYNMLVDLTKQ